VTRTRVRPARPWAPMGVAVAVLGTWWLVAHNSGAGWVQALGDVVFGALVIGMIGPAVLLARAKIRVVAVPLDSTAGLPVEVQVEASSRVRVRFVDPEGPEVFVGPVRGRKRHQDPATLLPRRRGLHDTATIDVATAAPFGLQWWTRRVCLPLPSTLHVAPRRGQPVPLPPWADERTGESSQRVPAEAGEARGTRPYRTGDNQRHVHWPATAHTGELMVRDLEGPSAEPITVTVALPPDPDEAERVAEQALGTVVVLLDRGAPVLLATTEATGPLAAPVVERLDAGRRLARAVAGPAAHEADKVVIAVTK
jgi:uncharacterized protein (DUF58 family)